MLFAKNNNGVCQYRCDTILFPAYLLLCPRTHTRATFYKIKESPFCHNRFSDWLQTWQVRAWWPEDLPSVHLVHFRSMQCSILMKNLAHFMLPSSDLFFPPFLAKTWTVPLCLCSSSCGWRWDCICYELAKHFSSVSSLMSLMSLMTWHKWHQRHEKHRRTSGAAKSMNPWNFMKILCELFWGICLIVHIYILICL